MIYSPSRAVIQGYFQQGLVRSLQPHSVSMRDNKAVSPSRPPTYADLTLQAHQRSSGLAVQSSGNRNAFVVPPHLATFGRRAGQKLPLPVQQKMESFFGTDFSDVQVHSGPEASAIGALAFTQGSNIYFAPGQYNPNSHFGQALLAHELTHVVQQRAGRVRNPFGSGMAVVQDPALEAEAERMGRQAATFTPGVFLQRIQPNALQRASRTGVSASTMKVRFQPGLSRSSWATRGAPVLQQVKRKRPAKSTTPGLSAKEIKGKKNKQEGDCGNFKRVRNWSVVTSQAGVIIQEITRTFNVTDSGGSALAGAALNSYVKNPASSVNATENKYWEIWTVDSSGTVSPGGGDTFGLCSIIPWDGTGTLDKDTEVKNTTKGSFQMTGKAQFYETAATPAVLGFTSGAANSAGSLLSRTTDPAGDLTTQGATAVGGPVNYEVTSAWDSTTGSQNYWRTKVTSKFV